MAEPRLGEIAPVVVPAAFLQEIQVLLLVGVVQAMIIQETAEMVRQRKRFFHISKANIMSDVIHVLKFTETGLAKLNEALLKGLTGEFALPLINDINMQLQQAEDAVAAEAKQLKDEAASAVQKLHDKIAAFEASAKAGVVHVLEEVKSAL